MAKYTRDALVSVSVLALTFSIVGWENKTDAKDSTQQTKGTPSEQQLALSPPMGWNSWNSFGVKVDEEAIRATADFMVSTGLKDVGYSYIVIDDYWHGGRDSNGNLFPDQKRFPSGIKALADYVHSKGLKFGIYSDAGTMTCGKMPGSYGFEGKDAKLFAEWGVDFLKYDYCFCPDYTSANNDYKMAIDRYKRMGDALKATGRPIIYSICEWGPRSPWLWGKEVGGHMWRTSYDVYDVWEVARNVGSPVGVVTSLDVASNLDRFAGPGGWNDPDMLVVGLKNTGNIKGGGCTEIEYRSQMSMWCMIAAPLMIGCDISKMDETTKMILSNKDVIDIDQDPLGKQGFRVIKKDGFEAWKKPLANNKVAIALLNRNSTDKSVSASWKELELKPDAKYKIYDVWKHTIVENTHGAISAKLKPHECEVYVFSPNDSK